MMAPDKRSGGKTIPTTPRTIPAILQRVVCLRRCAHRVLATNLGGTINHLILPVAYRSGEQSMVDAVGCRCVRLLDLPVLCGVADHNTGVLGVAPITTVSLRGLAAPTSVAGSSSLAWC